MRFAGPALVPRIVPAMAHLASRPGPPSLTVCAWDDESTGISMPRPPWRWGELPGRGEVPGFDSERIRVTFHRDPGIFCMLDVERRIALYRVRRADELPYYESAAPLRTILHWWLSPQQRQLVHAAGVGRAGRGMLLVGKGGAGKSTTAVACAASGFSYVADDFCLVASRPQPYAWSLYSTGKLDAGSVARMAGLSLPPCAVPQPPEKAVLFLHDHWPARVTTGFPIHAVVVPQITGCPDSTLAPTTPAAALTALAPSSLFLLAGAGQPALRVMSELVGRVPCYRLNLGTELGDVPALLASVLDAVHETP
jgi:hypothetical protein